MSDLFDIQQQQRRQDRLDDQSLQNFHMHHDIKSNAYKEMHQIVLLTSAGAFGLSLTFINMLRCPILFPESILIAWSCFVMCLFFLYRMHNANALSSLRNQTLINEWRKVDGQPTGELTKSVDKNLDTSNDPEIRNHDFNMRSARDLAVALLGVGMIFMLLFASMNLGNHGVSSCVTTETTRQI